DCDTRVVFSIFEGRRRKVHNFQFECNQCASDATLRTKISSRTPILWLFGRRFHHEDLEEDTRKLIQYYQDQGFFEARVSPVTRPGTNLDDVNLTFVVSEGTRYKVRNIAFEGNKQIETAKLKEGLILHSDQPFQEAVKEADRKRIM